MHNVALTWQQAAVLSAALGLAALAVSHAREARIHRLFPIAREAATISALYGLWQLAGSLSVLGTSGAFARAESVLDLEQWIHLPSEASVQRLVEHSSILVQACNLYYATMHFGGLFLFLLWLFLRHREHYRRTRLTLVLVTLTCLLVQLVPVAPPRLLAGFTDTATQFGQSVYGLGLAADQLSAMPSVHVAWAVLIGWTVLRVSQSPWRWVGPAHAVVTVFVVTATANHFWLDGIVAVILLAMCGWLQRATRASYQRHRNAQIGAPRRLTAFTR
ncbi:MAG: phosphatase PAP2 family protein [Actinomycetota bacterium]|nr:phosphatase PAP2 family protein [Actinomycetota bacterium]